MMRACDDDGVVDDDDVGNRLNADDDTAPLPHRIRSHQFPAQVDAISDPRGITLVVAMIYTCSHFRLIERLLGKARVVNPLWRTGGGSFRRNPGYGAQEVRRPQLLAQGRRRRFHLGEAGPLQCARLYLIL